MRVCLMIEGQESVSWEQWLALAGACEDAGIEALFRSDHYSSVFGILDRGSLDAWTTLAGLAARTRRLRLGTLVSPATFRHPSLLARAVTTVDHISDGRVELGLGAGWHELEHRANGFDFADTPTRIARFAEQLELIHREWTEDGFSFSGRHYSVDDCRALPKPVQQPHPWLIVGGSARRGTVDPAVRFADEYNTGFAPVDECRARRRTLDEACERAGRDPASLGFSLMTACVVGSNERETKARTERMLDRMGTPDSPVRVMLEAGRDGWIAGTVDQVVDRLAELEEAGVERVMLQHLAHDDLEMVALIGAEIVRRV